MGRELHRYGLYVSAVMLLAVGFAAATYLGSLGAVANQSKSTEEQLASLELRVSVLEATVEALTEGNDVASTQDSLHTLSGDYIERPESISGQSCSNFYPAGTTVFLSDWNGDVVGTGKLGDGRLVHDGLCAQPFEISNVPESNGYVVNFERRVAGSAYEFTLEDVREHDWYIEVISRYRP